MVIEDDQQRALLGYQSPSRMRTLITSRWRMTIAHADAWGELYDLANDPHEMDNLFEDPGHRGVRAELMEKLAYRQMELADRSPLPIGSRLMGTVAPFASPFGPHALYGCCASPRRSRDA